MLLPLVEDDIICADDVVVSHHHLREEQTESGKNLYALVELVEVKTLPVLITTPFLIGGFVKHNLAAHAETALLFPGHRASVDIDLIFEVETAEVRGDVLEFTSVLVELTISFESFSGHSSHRVFDRILSVLDKAEVIVEVQAA